MPQYIFMAGLVLAILAVPPLVRQYLCFRIIVPTGSMSPAILPGDHLLVWRLKSLARVRRGDLLVFRSTSLQKGDGSLLMIKRLIGLPGETVELNGGSLRVNGQVTAERYIKYPKTFEGRYEIPQGCYFFLGDNRSSSHDARYWAMPYVLEKEIIGKAGFRIWPLQHLGFIQ